MIFFTLHRLALAKYNRLLQVKGLTLLRLSQQPICHAGLLMHAKNTYIIHPPVTNDYMTVTYICTFIAL